MGILDVPASSRAELARTYERAGWRTVSRRGKVSVAQSNGTDLTQKSRTRWQITGPVVELKLVFTNFLLTSGLHEPANPYTVSFQVCIEDPTTDAGDSTGAVTIPVFFAGKRTGVMEASSVLESDPFVVNFATAGRVLWIRCSPTVASGDKWVNATTSSSSGSANFDGGGLGEGVVAGSSTIDSGTIALANAFCFTPAAILGRGVPATRKPAVLITGDSIAAETYNITAGNVSWPTRACMLAGYATTRISEGGERLFQIIAPATSWKRLRLGRHHTHVLSNYGTNDIYASARTLAQLKADVLAAAAMWASLGLKAFQATVLPRPGASTDGYMSVAGQSITDAAKETVRTGFNDWLLDASAAGARAQSGGALVGVLDPCQFVETNAAGVLTHNGGFWRVPAVVGAITGTATGYTTTTVTDSGAARTVNGDQGKVLAITSATTGAGQAAVVVSNTATTWTLLAAITLPTGTVTYQVGASYFVDGIHPSESAHDLIGNAIDVSAITL